MHVLAGQARDTSHILHRLVQRAELPIRTDRHLLRVRSHPESGGIEALRGAPPASLHVVHVLGQPLRPPEHAQQLVTGEPVRTLVTIHVHAVARPQTLLGTRREVRLHRVEVEVREQVHPVRITADHLVAEATAKHGPVMAMRAVVGLGEHRADVPHDLGQVALRDLDHQVVVVRHEREAVDARPEQVGHLGKHVDEHAADDVVGEHGLAAHRAIHHVVASAREVESRCARHGEGLTPFDLTPHPETPRPATPGGAAVPEEHAGGFRCTRIHPGTSAMCRFDRLDVSHPTIHDVPHMPGSP